MFMLVGVGVDAATEKVVVSASSDILVSIVCCLVGCVAWCVGQWCWGPWFEFFQQKKKEKIRKLFLFGESEKHQIFLGIF